MAVSKRLRYEILRRDNHTCRYCGASAPDVPLRVDHVTPVALGGSDKPDNLATSCEPCNNGKSSSSPDAMLVAGVADDALRWAAAMQQAAANLLEQEKPKEEYRAAFLTEWNRWGSGKDDKRKFLPLPGEWKASVERFRTAGLPVWVWEGIVDTAMGYSTVKPENKFKYCCGIAWKKVQAMHEDARALLGESTPQSEGPDPDDADSLIIEAAHLLWGQEWVLTFKKGPTPEQIAEFMATARDVLNSGTPEGTLVEAARYGAWFSTADAREALEHLENSRTFNERYAAQSVFSNAWYFSQGEVPPRQITDELWEDCEKLYELGTHTTWVTLAAAVAGLHGTTKMHAGLDVDGLNALGHLPGPLYAEEAWAVAWRNTAPDLSWPTSLDREAFRASLGRIREAHQHSFHDVYAAATTAGVYQDTSLEFHLQRMGSATAAAALAFPGGEH